MSQNPTVILVPIDNRPVTYRFPQLIAANAGLKAVTAPAHLIGSQHAPPSLEELTDWIEQSLSSIKPQALFVCLDSILYGGLVASRRSLDPVDEVLKRLERIANWKKLAGNGLQIFAQASITRIPHYNNSGTEPDYWKDYGEKIFRWSVLKHKEALGRLRDASELAAAQIDIPENVLTDFIKRRERNFKANQILIEMAKNKEVDYLVFSQDDTAEFGLNVLEKSQLFDIAMQSKILNVAAYAGTDEVIMTLMARWLTEDAKRTPKVSLVFSPKEGEKCTSNFEGRSLKASVDAQMRASNLNVIAPASSPGNDFAIVIHTAGDKQGDHVTLPDVSGRGTPCVHAESPGRAWRDPTNACDNVETVRNTISLLETATAPVVLCDVAYSNGADPLLIEQLLPRKDLLNKLYAYAGWNTTANAVGSALAVGVAQWYAKLHDKSITEASKQALFLRFADDWAYQAQVRAQLEGQASEEKMRQLMTPLLQRLANALEFDPGPVNLKLPWNRTFEVEIDFEKSTHPMNLL